MQLPGTLDMNSPSSSLTTIGSYLIVSRSKRGDVHRLSMTMQYTSKIEVNALALTFGWNADWWGDIRFNVEEEG